jgi:hypothetical protein
MRNMKLRDSAGQTHAYVWKDPNDGFAEPLDSREMYGKLPSELAEVFRGTGVASPTDISNFAPHNNQTSSFKEVRRFLSRAFSGCLSDHNHFRRRRYCPMTVNVFGLSLPIANPPICKNTQYKVSPLHNNSLRNSENQREQEEFHNSRHYLYREAGLRVIWHFCQFRRSRWNL